MVMIAKTVYGACPILVITKDNRDVTDDALL